MNDAPHSPTQSDQPPRPLRIVRYILGVLCFCLGAGLLLMSFPICRSDERFFAGVFFCLVGLVVIALGIVVTPKRKRRP